MSQSDPSSPRPDELEFTELEPLESELPELPDDAVLEQSGETKRGPAAAEKPAREPAGEPARRPGPKPAPEAKAKPTPQPPRKPAPTPEKAAKQRSAAAQEAAPESPRTPVPPEPPAGKVPAAKASQPEKAQPAEPRPASLESAPLASEAGATSGAPGAASAAAAGGVQLRELDKAPQHLRTASLIVIAGSLLPWMGHGGTWITFAAAKVVVILGVLLLVLYWKHRAGEKVAGLVAKLSDISLLPKKKEEEDEGKKKRRRKTADAGPDPSAVLQGAPFPTALHLVSLLAVIAGAVLPAFDPAVSEQGTYGKAVAEIALLGWGVATWAHIFAFQRGGKFNPIFPLMYLGHAFAGVVGALAGLGSGAVLQIVGGGIVGAGGIFAGYTIIEAMKQAKAEGDRKKAAAAEARRAARKARKG